MPVQALCGSTYASGDSGPACWASAFYGSGTVTPIPPLHEDIDESVADGLTTWIRSSGAFASRARFGLTTPIAATHDVWKISFQCMRDAVSTPGATFQFRLVRDDGFGELSEVFAVDDFSTTAMEDFETTITFVGGGDAGEASSIQLLAGVGNRVMFSWLKVESVGEVAPPVDYDALEQSICDGEPVEGYEFQQAGTPYRYTSSDTEETFAGQDYVPSQIAHDGLEFSNEDSSGNTTVRVPRTNAVAQLFIRYLPTATITLTIYRKHRSNPETIVVFTGRVVACQFEGPDARLTCAPISQAFRRRIPSMVYQGQCNRVLYGRNGCTLNREDHKETGTVLTVVGNVVTATAFGAQPDGWLTNGWAQLASGERRFIVDHVGTAITLMDPFPVLTPGTTIVAYWGCDLLEATCATKFDNLINYLGFPRIPKRNPYNGSIT